MSETQSGEVLSYRGGDGIEFKSYYASPAQPRCGVIMLRGVAGPDSGYTEIADRLAAVGYAALVHAWLVRGSDMDDATLVADVQAAASFMHARAELAGRPLAIFGYCKGGGFGALAAARCPEIKAVVEFHGFARRPDGNPDTRRHPIDVVGDIKQPVLLLHGQNDQLSPVDGMREFAAALTRSGGAVDMHVYPEADHGFAVSTHKGYRADAAGDSFTRAVDFLGRHFG